VSRVGHFGVAVAVIATAGSVVSWEREDPSRPAAPPPIADGAVLFRAKGCASCHDGPDSTARMDGFPSLAHAPEWAGTRRGGMSAEDYVAESIRSPSAFFSPAWSGDGGPTRGMPDLGLTQVEIDALVDYVLQG